MPDDLTNTDRNAAQKEFWNGDAGQKWVQYADRLDVLLAPFIDAVLLKTELQAGEKVLDIGCGGGSLSLGASTIVGPQGSVSGIDISRPLLDLASQRAGGLGHISFEEADASLYRSDVPVDAAISRFGVMFFDDPIAAFASLRGNLRPEGRLVFACWQEILKNEWLTLPLDTALPYFTSLPPVPPPDAPGPFAFADADRVRRILSDAGWRGIEIEPWEGPLTLPGESLRERAQFVLKMGPVAKMIADQVEDAKPILTALEQGFAEKQTSSGDVALGGAAWFVSAFAS
ncbi:MAG: methyltransferase domain-containing protein [Pseudomonadota bacterium]